mmetsp:Transcript_24339/g.78639  ORF Transcript_24339/g.78639 Transcript_24339/m.78639 type:complete len:221 (+) Transcript_24339:54-716(+)
MGATVSSEKKTIKFKYLAGLPFGLVGRGGAIRFFLLAHGIPFEEELFDMQTTWPKKKAELLLTNESPSGMVPLVEYGDMTLTQHIATMRYIAFDMALVSTPNGNYAQDVIADEYQVLRDAYVTAVFGGDKDKFKTLLSEKLTMFEKYYKKYGVHDVYVSVTLKDFKPLWGDIALFCLLRDIFKVGLLESKDDLPPRLQAMYTAFEAIPAIAEWEQKNKST